MTTDVAVPASPIRPRNPGLTFDASIPRHWLAGSGMFTQVCNGVNLLFPDGERFFVRSVRHYMAAIADDPELTARVKGFCGQEGRHARAHEDYFEILRAQGYDLEAFLVPYRRLAYEQLERLTSPELRLSATVALEHFTAIMAENALRERVLDHAHPTMARLLYWHAAEELEHKSVAFDVLKRVNPSYGLRMAGMAFATVTLGGFWIAATRSLLKQDRAAGRDTGHGTTLKPREGDERIWKRVFARGIREYVRRDFHPSHIDNGHLAAEYLASAGFGAEA